MKQAVALTERASRAILIRSIIFPRVSGLPRAAQIGTCQHPQIAVPSSSNMKRGSDGPGSICVRQQQQPFPRGARELEGQLFAVSGVPFDGAVTHRPGARFAPQEIRRACLMLCDGIAPGF